MNDLDSKLEPFFDKYNVKNRDSDSKEYFSAALSIAVNEYSVSVSKLADDLEVAPSTIKRWSNGSAHPLPRMQKEVLRYIARQLE